MANSNLKQGNTGNRYTETQKKKILKFVESQGRGGIVRAKEKFGVSYIALKRWMDAKNGGKKGKAIRSDKAPNKSMMKFMDRIAKSQEKTATLIEEFKTKFA